RIAMANIFFVTVFGNFSLEQAAWIFLSAEQRKFVDDVDDAVDDAVPVYRKVEHDGHDLEQNLHLLEHARAVRAIDIHFVDERERRDPRAPDFFPGRQRLRFHTADARNHQHRTVDRA